MKADRRDTRVHSFVVRAFDEGALDDLTALKWKALFALLIHNIAQVGFGLHSIATALGEDAQTDAKPSDPDASGRTDREEAA